MNRSAFAPASEALLADVNGGYRVAAGPYASQVAYPTAYAATPSYNGAPTYYGPVAAATFAPYDGYAYAAPAVDPIASVTNELLRAFLGQPAATTTRSYDANAYSRSYANDYATNNYDLARDQYGNELAPIVDNYGQITGYAYI